MTPRCYSLSSNGGKGSRWGGSSLQVLVSMAAWFCSARKQGLWCRHPLRSLGVGAAGCQPCSAVPCRGLCASLLALLHVGDGVQRVQLLPAVLVPVCCSGGWCRNTELHRPSFCIVAPRRAPRVWADKSNPPVLPSAFTAVLEAPKLPQPRARQLSTPTDAYLLSALSIGGDQCPHFCVDKCTQYYRWLQLCFDM